MSRGPSKEEGPTKRGRSSLKRGTPTKRRFSADEQETISRLLLVVRLALFEGRLPFSEGRLPLFKEVLLLFVGVPLLQELERREEEWAQG
jgi:hypothetical protein